MPPGFGFDNLLIGAYLIFIICYLRFGYFKSGLYPGAWILEFEAWVFKKWLVSWGLDFGI